MSDHNRVFVRLEALFHGLGQFRLVLHNQNAHDFNVIPGTLTLVSGSVQKTDTIPTTAPPTTAIPRERAICQRCLESFL